MTTTTVEIEKLLKWSEPQIRQTSRGIRCLRTAEPTQEFRAIWKTNRQVLKDAGLGWTEYQGVWTVNWWTDPPKDFMEETAAKVAASYKKVSDITVPSPDGLAYMPYQLAAIEFAQGRNGTLFGDEMGLGKTIEAIGVINNDATIKNVLVICPSRLKINWSRELNKWLTRPMTVGLTNGILPATNVVIIAYTSCAKFEAEILARKWDLVVMDEIHYIKNPGAQRTRTVTNIAKETARKIGMTGTPIQNRIGELFTVLNLLDPVTWNDRNKFFRRYVYYANETRLAELQRLLRTSVMIRRMKKDVLTELPAKRRQTIIIGKEGYENALAHEREVMAKFEKQLLESHVELELAKASGNEAEYKSALARLRSANTVCFAEISKARHETAKAKVPDVIEQVKGFLDATSEKIVVFAHHVDVLEAIHAAFPGSGLIHGQVSQQAGQAALDRFQTDPDCRVLVSSILAGGLGLNMTAGSVAIFAELDWVPTNLDQAESRLHRKGQELSTLFAYVILEDSLDGRMIDILLEKLAIIDSAMGDEKDGDEPLFPNLSGNTDKSAVTITMKEYRETTLVMPEAQMKAIHTGLRMLARVCDGAVELDGQGFNKLDTAVGHRLATLNYLSPRQALLGQKLVNRYRGQLPADLVAVAKGTPATQPETSVAQPTQTYDCGL